MVYQIMVCALEKNRVLGKEREVWDEEKDVTNFYMVTGEGLINRVEPEQRTKGREKGRSLEGRSGGQ